MALPPKELLYTITDVAQQLGTDVKTIEDYLITGKLQASVYLPRVMLGHYTEQPNWDGWRYGDDSEYIYDIDENDPDGITMRQGLFNLFYEDIAWDENGKAILKKGELCLSLPDQEGYFGFEAPYALNQDSVVITLEEIKRFRDEHKISVDVQTKHESKFNNGSNLHTKEKESLLKLLIVLAVEGYRYNPGDKKSSVTSDIVSDASKLGISIDPDTVRKWLKEASTLLPREDTDCTEIVFT